MNQEELDLYPISHKGKVYNILTSFDMTFIEVRAMLDWLEEHGAFQVTLDDEFMGPGKLFTCEIPGSTFEVDVQGFEVLVFRRIP